MDNEKDQKYLLSNSGRVSITNLIFQGLYEHCSNSNIKFLINKNLRNYFMILKVDLQNMPDTYSFPS